MPPPPAADDPWSEVLLGWAVAVGLVYAALRFLPGAAGSHGAAWAWVAVAVGFHLARRRPLVPQGIAWRSVRASAKKVALYSAVFLPLYAGGFLLATGGHGWRVPSPQLFIVAFIGNLYFAALPEEIFFRGFVQPRLADAARARSPEGAKVRRVLFVPLSRPVVEAAALFAVTHAIFLGDPFSLAGLERLTTFFPGLLFGALREESRDVMTPALFHATCNAWLYCLQHGYLV